MDRNAMTCIVVPTRLRRAVIKMSRNKDVQLYAKKYFMRSGSRLIWFLKKDSEKMEEIIKYIEVHELIAPKYNFNR